MGQVNRNRLPLSVTSSEEISVVSKSGQRKLTLDAPSHQHPPSHKSNYLTVGETLHWALLIVWCNYAHLSWYWPSHLVPSVYLRWDLVQLIWLYVPLLGSHRYVQSSGIPVLWCLRGLNFKDTESLYSFHSNEGLGSVWREWTDTSLHQERHTLSQSPQDCVLFLPHLPSLFFAFTVSASPTFL